jgi:hypothetical protein
MTLTEQRLEHNSLRRDLAPREGLPFTIPWRNLTVMPLEIPLIAITGACVLTSTRTAYEVRR